MLLWVYAPWAETLQLRAPHGPSECFPGPPTLHWALVAVIPFIHLYTLQCPNQTLIAGLSESDASCAPCCDSWALRREQQRDEVCHWPQATRGGLIPTAHRQFALCCATIANEQSGMASHAFQCSMPALVKAFCRDNHCHQDCPA